MNVDDMNMSPLEVSTKIGRKFFRHRPVPYVF